MTESVLTSERSGAVLTLTLNRPEKRNALDDALWAALAEALRGAAADPEVRALVLTGAGGAFCAGADLGGLERDLHPLRRMRVVEAVTLALHELPLPTVAKVDGAAVGAGWNLALCCDLVVATAEARFSQIFARRGLSLDCGGSWLLPRLVGMQQAKRLAYLAEMLDAEEARALGLVTWVREREEIDAFVDELAGRLAAGPPIALAQSKALLHEATTTDLAAALAGEARAQTVNLASRDTAAAYTAFREGVDPQFTGAWRRTEP